MLNVLSEPPHLIRCVLLLVTFEGHNAGETAEAFRGLTRTRALCLLMVEGGTEPLPHSWWVFVLTLK